MQSHIQYSADISPLFTTLANTYPNSDQGQVVGGEREKKCHFIRGHTLIPFASLSTLPRASNPLHCEEVGCWGEIFYKGHMYQISSLYVIWFDLQTLSKLTEDI